MILNWKTSKAEYDAIASIAQRATKLAARLGVIYPLRDAMMDLTATHANGMPIDLDGLATAPEADFGHDVFGIYRHLDRNTGRLMDCFVPRYRR